MRLQWELLYQGQEARPVLTGTGGNTKEHGGPNTKTNQASKGGPPQLTFFAQ